MDVGVAGTCTKVTSVRAVVGWTKLGARRRGMRSWRGVSIMEAVGRCLVLGAVQGCSLLAEKLRTFREGLPRAEVGHGSPVQRRQEAEGSDAAQNERRHLRAHA